MIIESLAPRFEMSNRRKSVAFFRVTSLIREHEVVAEIVGVQRPWNEVIDSEPTVS